MTQAEADAEQELAPRPPREATSWTRPLRGAASGYLVVTALVTLATNVLFETRANIERSISVSNPLLTQDQLQRSADFGYAAGWALVIVIVAGSALLATGSYRGWGWVFWVDLAVLAVGSVGVVTNVAALQNPAVQVLPVAAVALDLALSVLALVLLAWFIAAALRYGPWGMRRPKAA